MPSSLRSNRVGAVLKRRKKKNDRPSNDKCNALGSNRQTQNATAQSKPVTGSNLLAQGERKPTASTSPGMLQNRYNRLSQGSLECTGRMFETTTSSSGAVMLGREDPKGYNWTCKKRVRKRQRVGPLVRSSANCSQSTVHDTPLFLYFTLPTCRSSSRYYQ